MVSPTSLLVPPFPRLSQRDLPKTLFSPFSAQRNIVTLSWDPEENGRNNNSPATGNSETTVHISVRHSRTSNADSEVLSLSFPNGRGVRLTIVTMDKPPAEAPETREQANLEEFLEPPTP